MPTAFTYSSCRPLVLITSGPACGPGQKRTCHCTARYRMPAVLHYSMACVRDTLRDSAVDPTQASRNPAQGRHHASRPANCAHERNSGTTTQYSSPVLQVCNWARPHAAQHLKAALAMANTSALQGRPMGCCCCCCWGVYESCCLCKGGGLAPGWWRVCSTWRRRHAAPMLPESTV